MADIEFVVGDFGDDYDITIYDEDTGSPLDISGFSTYTLTITSTDEATEVLSKSLSAPGDTGVVRWSMLTADTASVTAGTYKAQILMVDASVTIRRKTEYMTVRIIGKLD
jgi:hypothetical protein